MKTVCALLLSLTVGTSGCSMLGIGTGGDTVTRILADIGCLTALVNAGVTVMGDPTVNNASTATDVLTAIGTIGASNVPGTVLAACKDTLSYAAEDASALAKIIKGTPGTTSAPQNKALKAAQSAPKPKAPAAPTPVQVVIPGR